MICSATPLLQLKCPAWTTATLTQRMGTKVTSEGHSLPMRAPRGAALTKTLSHTLSPKLRGTSMSK